MTNLRILFIAVSLLEFFYFLCAMLPPFLIRPLTGWELSADGHWITKLIGLSLGFMGYIAWTFRNNPNVQVAKGLAAYQLASATMDWIMWITMREEGIFSNALAQTTVVAAIISHYLLGILLSVAISKTPRA